MSTQKEIPNALRLADWLENCTVEDLFETSLVEEAYEELRAQHELIQKLKAALETCRYVLSIESLTFTADLAQKAIDAAEAHK